MSRTPAFVVFSDDWGGHPSSCQHLFRQIAADTDVLWVNTIGMRRPTFSLRDLRKAITKISRMLRRGGAARGRVAPPARLEVVQPVMLPFPRFAVVRWLNRRSVARSVADWRRRHGSHFVVMVSTVPNACDHVSDIHADRVVYYCVDDFSRWPGLDSGLVRQMEQQLIRSSDVLVATAQKLREQLSDGGRSVHMLAHGVDLPHFSTMGKREHPVLQDLARPRFGYIGLVDERTDQGLLAGVAALLPDVTFVMVGNIATDVDTLRALPNVHFAGPVPYEALPEVMAGLDALMLPYLVNEFTATISPLKLKEYLATGLPVISTPLPEAIPFAGLLSIAGDVAGWVRALREVPGQDIEARRSRCQELLSGESWSSKAQRLRELCGVA